MTDHDEPPTADMGADRLVDDMKRFLRGGPVPDTAPDGPDGPRDLMQSWEFGGATADPPAWTPSVAGQDTATDRVIGPYQVIRWVDRGGDLSDQLAGGPFAPRAGAELVRSLARAMAYAHDRGVLHRDVKPQNVPLTADRTPKPADFGLARPRTDDAGGGLTHTGAVMGTPAYMAPEQADDDEANVDTGVYALGAVLCEVLTGAPPFRGDSKEAVLKQVRESEPPRPSSQTADLPVDLELICLRCLSKDATERYPTIAELVADLDRYLAGVPLERSPWRRPSRSRQAW